ncbi:MAG: hypothetical protein P4L99_23820 [Chthoniobacter sp.]|nr:hypothetical protein [Chthoniobacter sp.]
MKTSRPAFFRHATAMVPRPVKAAIVLALCGASVACTSTGTHHESAAPLTYSSNIDRPDGVVNTPNNTGNPPSVLSPSTINWRDVRQDVF